MSFKIKGAADLSVRLMHIKCLRYLFGAHVTVKDIMTHTHPTKVHTVAPYQLIADCPPNHSFSAYTALKMKTKSKLVCGYVPTLINIL